MSCIGVAESKGVKLSSLRPFKNKNKKKRNKKQTPSKSNTQRHDKLNQQRAKRHSAGFSTALGDEHRPRPVTGQALTTGLGSDRPLKAAPLLPQRKTLMERDFFVSFSLSQAERSAASGKQCVRLMLISGSDRQEWMETSNTLVIPVLMCPGTQSGSTTAPPSMWRGAADNTGGLAVWGHMTGVMQAIRLASSKGSYRTQWLFKNNKSK